MSEPRVSRRERRGKAPLKRFKLTAECTFMAEDLPHAFLLLQEHLIALQGLTEVEGEEPIGTGAQLKLNGLFNVSLDELMM